MGDDRIQRVVYPLHNLLEVSMVLVGIGAGRKLAFYSGLANMAASAPARSPVDALIQTSLEEVEIAVVVVRDLGRMSPWNLVQDLDSGWNGTLMVSRVH